MWPSGITSHGFAFNVTTDLRDFELIIPCGIPDHAGHQPGAGDGRKWPTAKSCPALETVAHQAARQFGLVFDQQVLAVESLADAARPGGSAAAPAFPAEDTPLRVPAEVEPPASPRPSPRFGPDRWRCDL